LITETKNISFLEINARWTKKFQQNKPYESSESEDVESDLEKSGTKCSKE